MTADVVLDLLVLLEAEWHAYAQGRHCSANTVSPMQGSRAISSEGLWGCRSLRARRLHRASPVLPPPRAQSSQGAPLEPFRRRRRSQVAALDFWLKEDFGPLLILWDNEDLSVDRCSSRRV